MILVESYAAYQCRQPHLAKPDVSYINIIIIIIIPLDALSNPEACRQLSFMAQSSASAVPRQVDLRWPFFLLPRGVHQRNTLEMSLASLRSTRPIKRHLLLIRIIHVSYSFMKTEILTIEDNKKLYTA